MGVRVVLGVEPGVDVWAGKAVGVDVWVGEGFALIAAGDTAVGVGVSTGDSTGVACGSLSQAATSTTVMMQSMPMQGIG